ncbi:MAG: hypothetical protein JSR91_19280 [Proteobacteria bacterium]|nr:hypothetical protein [Pseudomonadota bacterium]
MVIEVSSSIFSDRQYRAWAVRQRVVVRQRVSRLLRESTYLRRDAHASMHDLGQGFSCAKLLEADLVEKGASTVAGIAVDVAPNRGDGQRLVVPDSLEPEEFTPPAFRGAVAFYP